MAVSLTFLPSRLADILNYAQQVSDLITAEGFDPTTIGWVSGDVTAFGTKLSAAQDAFAALNSAIAAKGTATTALTGPGAALDQLVSLMRELANKSRASSATDDALRNIGIFRKGPPTPVAAPTVSPSFEVMSIESNIVNVRFKEAGSANPRAKIPGAAGVQIAIVNGANAPVADEEISAPNVYASRSPAALSTVGWPGKVRLYARWITAKGLVGPWSDSVNAVVQ